MVSLRLAPVAEHALLVEFGDTIHDATSERIAALDRALAAAPPAGLREVVPGMVNLLVDFDPLVTDHAAIEAAVRDCLGRPAPASAAGTRRETARDARWPAPRSGVRAIVSTTRQARVSTRCSVSGLRVLRSPATVSAP